MYHEIIVAQDQLASNEKLSTPFTLYYCIQPKKCTVHWRSSHYTVYARV